mmetsp:Transcript_26133/g.85847  ORF Transcript_26133/g.85847 Transcript_26133/m.85847 type:complete len:291 (+) Transcript_26133:1-873(+)
MTCKPVPRVTSVAELHARIAAREPAILAANGDVGAFRDRLIEADPEMPVRYVRGGSIPRYVEAWEEAVWGVLHRLRLWPRVRLRDALQASSRRRRCWSVSGAELHLDIAPLSACLDPLTPRAAERNVHGLWVSSRGCRTGLHFDVFGGHNLHLSVCGRKRVWLAPPGHDEGCRSFGGHTFFLRFAGAANLADDAACDKDMPRFVADLTAGDVLFIPAFWWHQLEHLDELNASFTRWFYEPEATHPKMPELSVETHLKLIARNLIGVLVLAPIFDLIALMRARVMRGHAKT